MKHSGSGGGSTATSGTPPLPLGASTEAKQDTGNTSLASIDSKLTTNTATISRVSASTSSVQLLAANTSRKGATFYNESNKICYLKCGTTASATSYTIQVKPDGYAELDVGPMYNGRVDGIWESGASGAMQITEFT